VCVNRWQQQGRNGNEQPLPPTPGSLAWVAGWAGPTTSPSRAGKKGRSRHAGAHPPPLRPPPSSSSRQEAGAL
jgi:hypothetical protein